MTAGREEHGFVGYGEISHISLPPECLPQCPKCGSDTETEWVDKPFPEPHVSRKYPACKNSQCDWTDDPKRRPEATPMPEWEKRSIIQHHQVI